MNKKQIARKKTMYAFINTVGALMVFSGFAFFIVEPFLMFYTILPGMLILFLMSFLLKKLSIKYKDIFIKNAVEQWVTSGKFESKRGIIQEEVYNEALLKKEDRYKSEDYMYGLIDAYPFRSADLWLQDVRNSGKNSTTVTMFKGKYIEVFMNTGVSSPICIKAFKKGKHLSKLGFMKIEVNNFTFNKTFDLYVKDENESREVMSDYFMDKLLALHKKYPKFEIAIKNDKLIIAINNGKDAYDLSMYKSFKDTCVEEVKTELDMIKAFVSLVEEI